MAGKRFLIIVLFVLVCLAGVSCLVLGQSWNRARTAAEISSRATATAEAYLTQAYGVEVSRAVENFELRWNSLEAHISPTIMSEVATGPYLERSLNREWVEASCDGPFWSVITLAEVRKLRVVEYSPERFKAVAAVERRFNRTTTKGEIIKSAEPGAICAVYVFVREDQTWKLAGLFATSGTSREIARDWELSSQWLKDIIGGLPEGELFLWLAR